MMRVYKVVEIQFYNQLMDIYRQHYSKVGNNACEVSVTKESEDQHDEIQQQSGGDRPFWSTFEQTVEQVRQQQKEQKKRRTRD